MSHASESNHNREAVVETQDQAWHMDALDWWNVVLVIGLGMTVIATIFVTMYAKRKALDTDRSVSEARAQASAASLETEQIKKQNLALQLTVERERTARLELEKQVSEAANTATAAAKKADATSAKIQPRSFTNAERAAFIKIAGTDPKGQLEIVAVMGDAESIGFANELNALVKSAGWTTTGVNQGVFTPTVPVGVEIQVHDRDSVPPSTYTLVPALEEAGILLRGVALTPTRPSGSLTIVVGHKQ